MNFQFSADSVNTVREFFTNEEWDIIDHALSEFQDHCGEDEEQDRNFDSVNAKLSAMFKMTK